MAISHCYIFSDVAKYKPDATSDTDTQALAEAQMISEGIAVAQQAQWCPTTPVYMLLVMRTNICVYRADFTDELLRAVRIGTRRMQSSGMLRPRPLQ